MITLTLANHQAQVEKALVDTLRLAFLQRQALPDVPALKALDISAGADGALVYVQDQGRVYVLDLYSTAAEALPLIAAPTTPPSRYQTARWVRSASTVNYGPNQLAPLNARQAGFMKMVDLFAGRGGTDQGMLAVMASTPALLLLFTGDDLRPQSCGYPGSLYENTLSYQVWAFSGCYRGAPWALWGTPVAQDAALDPGVHAIVGQVRHVLAGLSGSDPDAPRGYLGLQGVAWVEVGGAEVLSEDEDQRLFVTSLEIRVKTRFYCPDESTTAIPPATVRIEERLAASGRAKTFDRANYIAQGYLVEVGPGLTRTLGPGVAVVGGTPVASTPGAHTFGARRDIYRDLKPDGTLVWTETLVGYPEPPAVAGALRVGVTTTDSSAVIGDRLLCSASVAFRGPYQIAP